MSWRQTGPLFWLEETFSKKMAKRKGAKKRPFIPICTSYMPAMVPTGNVSAMTQIQIPKITAKITVRRSRFFSQMPDPAVALYIDEAIMSETPVPLPECIRIKMTVKTAEIAMMMRSAILRGLTVETPWLADRTCKKRY